MRTLWFWPIAVGLILLSADPSSATQWTVESPAWAKAHHALVFLGTVESVQDSTVRLSKGTGVGKRRSAWVRMNSIWKGVPQRSLLRVTESVDPEGTPKLKPGVTFVFYADSTAGGWVFDYTSRTREITRAKDDLAALGKPAIVQRIPGRKNR